MTPTILVPIDFSAGSEHALDVAAKLFGSAGARYVLLNVVPMPPAAATVAAVWVAPTAEDIRTIERQLQDLAARHDVKATVNVAVAEDVGVATLRTARESSCDVIAMGTHGRGGFKRALLGSVADYVSRHADCPVLTIRGPAKST